MLAVPRGKSILGSNCRINGPAIEISMLDGNVLLRKTNFGSACVAKARTARECRVVGVVKKPSPIEIKRHPVGILGRIGCGRDRRYRDQTGCQYRENIFKT